MNHLLAPQATQGMLKKNLPLAQGFVTYSYAPQGAKFFYYWWHSSGHVIQMSDVKQFIFFFLRHNSYLSIDFSFLGDWI